MTTILLLTLGIVFVALLLVTGMQPVRPRLSQFSLHRRHAEGDLGAARDIERVEHGGDIAAFLHVVSTLLLVIVILLSVVAWGWLFGVIIGVVVVITYRALARFVFIERASAALYRRIESQLLTLVQKFPRVFAMLGDAIPSVEQPSIDSKEELIHIVTESPHALSADDRRLLTHGLAFSDRRVTEVMTPRSVIDTVPKGELLGPLTLDTLYKTGHSRLPVIDGDIDHIVGILYTQDLLVATSKKTPTAAEAMSQKVFYIRKDHTLGHALSAFLRTHHHLFIVVNEYRETVGVLTLEDVIEALLGRKIIDEFDAHDNLRAVAERNPRGNNTPKSHTDV